MPNHSDEGLAQAAFEIVKGVEAGTWIALAAATSTFGRAPGNTHVVKDTTMSRQHAKVFVRDGRHWIADLNSSHGTFVNGVKVTLQTLVDGDEVSLGTTVLRYAERGTQAKAATAGPAAGTASPAASPKASAAATPAPPAAGMRTDSFDLELPDAPPPPAPGLSAPPAAAPASGSASGPKVPLPPVATGYRRALTREGEDPFAEETKAKEARDSEAAAASAASPAAPRENAPPSIEMRGATARQFASRGAAPAAAAAASPGSTHVPPPLAHPDHARGSLTFLRDELDQRGPAARFAAGIFALAAAGALFWLAMWLFEAAPKADANAPTDEEAPTGPSRPALPTRR